MKVQYISFNYIDSELTVSDLPWIIIFWMYTSCVTLRFSVMQKKTPASISSQSLMQDLDPKGLNSKKVIRGLIQTQQGFWFYCILLFKNYCDSSDSISKFFSYFVLIQESGVKSAIQFWIV